MTYRSETELRKHEFTHVRSYKCMECDFAERPFTSRQDLRKHQAKYHMTSVDFAIPLQIRSLATKSIPPLRRKTQRLGFRESDVGLSPIDQTSPNDLRPIISNARIDAHRDPQTTRECAAAPKDLNLTDTSERNDIEVFNSADIVSTSCAESGVAHKLESVDKLKAIHSPEEFSMAEANFPTGEPIQTAPETPHDNSLRIDHIGKSRHEPNTSNKNPPKDIDVVHVDDSTESILTFEDGHSDVESVEFCVSHYVQLAAKVHLKNHGIHTSRSTNEEARRIKGLSKGFTKLKWEPELEWETIFACARSTCWSNLIGSYIDATFANQNAIPGISQGDTKERLVKMIDEIGAMTQNGCYAFLDSPTTFLPQEVIRFERAMKLDGDNGMDLPTFVEKYRMWGPKHLKEYYESSMSETSAYLDIMKKDIDHWLYNYIGPFLYYGTYLYRFPDCKYVLSWIRDDRRGKHTELWKYIIRLMRDDHRPGYHSCYHPVNIDVDKFAHYVLSLICKEGKPTEMVNSLKEYLEPSK